MAGIVGPGYVGLPLAQLFTSQIFRVRGLDIDASKTRQILQNIANVTPIMSCRSAMARMAEKG
jgi:UDP-N-acetyl-D-mannosaminuronate dehydrogenase